MRIAKRRLLHYGLKLTCETQQEALRYALARGSRSGRVVHQFARDRTGQQRPN